MLEVWDVLPVAVTWESSPAPGRYSRYKRGLLSELVLLEALRLLVCVSLVILPPWDSVSWGASVTRWPSLEGLPGAVPALGTCWAPSLRAVSVPHSGEGWVRARMAG